MLCQIPNDLEIKFLHANITDRKMIETIKDHYSEYFNYNIEKSNYNLFINLDQQKPNYYMKENNQIITAGGTIKF
jgi:hypothetical protein